MLQEHEDEQWPPTHHEQHELDAVELTTIGLFVAACVAVVAIALALLGVAHLVDG